MGRRQIGKKYFQRQEDKKRDRYKNVVAKQKEKGALKLKKKVQPGQNYQREEWPIAPPPIAPPITGEFTKAWNAHSKKTYLKGWGVGIVHGATLALAVAYASGYLK